MWERARRTNTLGPGLAYCPPGVTRLTLRSAVNRATRTILRHAVLAGAHIAFVMTTHGQETAVMCLLAHALKICKRTNTFRSGVIESKPDVARKALGKAVHRTFSSS